MTSFFMFGITLIATIALALGILTHLTFSGERRAGKARTARLRARAAVAPAQATAEMINLADRRKVVRTDIPVERRQAA